MNTRTEERTENTAINRAGQFAENVAMLWMVQSMLKCEAEREELIEEDERDMGWMLLFQMPICGEA